MDVDFDETVGLDLGLRRYVHLVTEALGMTGECSYVDVQRPAGAYLALDGRVARFPDRDVALLWSEEGGWSAAVETESGDDPVVLAHMGGDLVPPPHAVAEWASDFLRDEHNGDPAPAYPAVDPARRLMSYATVELMSA